jgi:hypothetical protein
VVESMIANVTTYIGDDAPNLRGWKSRSIVSEQPGVALSANARFARGDLERHRGRHLVKPAYLTGSGLSVAAPAYCRSAGRADGCVLADRGT